MDNATTTVHTLPHDTHGVDWTTVALRLFICIAGILGNLMVIFVIVVLREYKKAVTHWYVLQLAIADSMFLLTLPFKIVEDVENEWTFDAGMCKAKETILFLNYYASILFLMIMSIDRYIAVCHGFSDQLQKYRTHRAAYVITGVTWCIALLLCIPVMMYSNKAGFEPNCLCSYEFPRYEKSPEEICKNEGFVEADEFHECLEVQKLTLGQEGSCKSFSDSAYHYSFDLDFNYDYVLEEIEKMEGELIEGECHYWDKGPAWKAFLIFNFICMFVLPFFIMAFCYTMIIQKLHDAKLKTFRTNSRTNSVASTGALMSSSDRGSSSSKLKRSRSKSAAAMKACTDRNRVTIMCAVLVTLFVVCWLPFHTIHLAKIKGMGTDQKWCILLPTIASLIAYMNSALNPYLYNFLGTRFGIRLRGALSTVHKSIKRRASSVSSSNGVVYHRRKTGDGSSQGTIITKLRGRKSKGESSLTNDDVFLQNRKSVVEKNVENKTNSNEERLLSQTVVVQKNEIEDNIA